MTGNHRRWVESGDLGLTRLLWVFAVLSVVFVGLLALVPLQTMYREWRDAQEDYNEHASARGGASIEPRIQQVFKPEAGVVDRCTSCHLGMGAAQPHDGMRLFREHPKVPHETGDLGCTACHGGQGRATTAEAAHGLVRHWEEPMLPLSMSEAGCGTCHTHLHALSPDKGVRGEALFRRYDCTACHRVHGTGRGNGPDLSTAGLKGYRHDWHAHHLAAAVADPAFQGGQYGEVPEEDVAAINDYLHSLSGAPRLEKAKALAYRSGCRGCHKVGGIGGDEGPDLSREGLKSPTDLDFSGVRGPHTPASWQIEHLLDPGRVVAGSRMPDQGFSEETATMLALWVMSLRAKDLPHETRPRDRIMGERFGAWDMARDGASLFAAFCSGCHGPHGEGRRFANRDTVFPAIGNPDFLALASDDFLRATITLGRPGRGMPAWSERGLHASDIDALVGHLRSLAPGTPEPEGEALVTGDPVLGKGLYARHCQGCHGEAGKGGEAPALTNPGFLAAASDQYIAGTILRGRGGTSMRPFGRPMLGFPVLEEAEVAAIAAYLRSVGEADGRKGHGSGTGPTGQAGD